MTPTSIILAAAAKAPLESPAWDGLKNLVNSWSPPQYSLPFFFVPLFVLMIVLYRQWTRPLVFVVLGVVFCIAYFGSMAIDGDYLSILAKADNVPITLMLLSVGFFLWVAFRQAAHNDQRIREGRPLVAGGRDERVLVWPDLVYSEMLAIILGSVVLLLWAILLPAPLEAPANPAGPPNPSKAPWYFLGLQEMLVYFDPWMAGVVLPTMIITGLIGMPYFDTNPKGNGYYTLRQRPFAIFVWLFGFVILWVVLIVFGTFLRGPNWNFFGPYEYWDANLTVPLTNINLSDYWHVFLWGSALPENPFHREWMGIVLVGLWMVGLPILLARTVMSRMYDQMGLFRFSFMVIHLVVMGLLPLKMVLRWTVNLKYFVYLPEFNLNL